jgi:hypothetical protein
VHYILPGHCAYRLDQLKKQRAKAAEIKMAAGGTTLHGSSDQKFGMAQALKPYASKAAVYLLQSTIDTDRNEERQKRRRTLRFPGEKRPSYLLLCWSSPA